jgi:competence protein ComEC
MNIITRKNILLFVIMVCVAGLLIACDFAPLSRVSPQTPVQFGVFNVGEGLAQIVKADTNAIIFDMGPPEGYADWHKKFIELGKTRVSAIVLSHDHKDHWGGLQLLDTTVLWDGCIVTSPYVDTASLRDSFPLWKDRIRFRTIAAGDTLALPGGGAGARCIWPPAEGVSISTTTDDFKNRTSLVFLVIAGGTTALITSDIDSFATRQICLNESTALKADILVVPHHGSGGSLDPVFYGYVRPAVAILSYGIDNSYGHPSPSVLLWLSQTGTVVRATAIDGDCFFESNRYYWTAVNN